ncbi:O-antigen ligase family protein [Geomonas propionica]|uniref:O-antigen ligase family protein n=1 Tax=Geomonas propionica TaxID=2798582 RepID=A0ABS0YVI8_9BACT|nr:O-antigen ligase family protein [Geomonas propionica]MBJ6801936.1 O-antigen ligase family protein [Geomonas propionica]
MISLRNLLIFALFLLSGTHAVPALRVSMLGFSTPYSILVFYLIIFVVLLKVVADRGRIRFPAALMCGFVVYYFSVAVSNCFAVEVDKEALFKWFFFPLMPVCIALIADRVELLKKSLLLFAISGFCVFCYGIYGFVTWNVGDFWQHTLGYFGVTYEASSRNGDMLYLQSTFWILVAIALYADRVSGWLRLFCAVLAAMVGMGLVLSLARGAWISGVLTVVALVVVQRMLNKELGVPQSSYLKTKLVVITLLLAGLLYLFTSTVGQDYQQLLSSRTDSISTLSEGGGNSNLARTRLLIRAAEVAVTHPLGVGIWNLKYYLDNFYITGLASAENIYFHMAAEQGVMGLAAYLFILGWTGRRLYRYLAVTGHGSDKWVGWCLLCILTNWSLYGLFNIMIETLWYWSGMSLAIAAATLVEQGRLEAPAGAGEQKPLAFALE